MTTPQILTKTIRADAIKLTAKLDGQPITQSQFLDNLENAESFRTAFNDTLAMQDFGSFFWEMPHLTGQNLGDPFECMLLESNGLAKRQPDQNSFARYFSNAPTKPAQSVITIDNLGGDARLVIPAALTDPQIYTDIASFTRHAPPAQRDALWQATARATKATIKERNLWLSTSGWGVAWLHIRLDQRPKYYTHKAYKDAM